MKVVPTLEGIELDHLQTTLRDVDLMCVCDSDRDTLVSFVHEIDDIACGTDKLRSRILASLLLCCLFASVDDLALVILAATCECSVSLSK